MTLFARTILSDCEVALELMDNEVDPKRLRVLWIGSLAILRSVGHVLQKVDGRDPVLRSRLAMIWPTVKVEPIFAEFIEPSRHAALKEGEVLLFDRGSISLLIQDHSGGRKKAILDDCLFMPITQGFRAGEDGRDVYRDAIDWWIAVIEDVEVSS